MLLLTNIGLKLENRKFCPHPQATLCSFWKNIAMYFYHLKGIRGRLYSTLLDFSSLHSKSNFFSLSFLFEIRLKLFWEWERTRGSFFDIVVFASEFSIQAILFGVSLLTIQSEYWTPLQKVQFGSLFLHQYTNYYTSGLKSGKKIHQLYVSNVLTFIPFFQQSNPSIDIAKLKKSLALTFTMKLDFSQ